eukprot:g2206.t1
MASASDAAALRRTHLNHLFLAVGFDMLAIGLIVPLISPFSRELGASPRTLGFLSSVYGVTQLASSPVLGSASDRISRRTVLLLSLIGGAVGYALLGLASSIWMIVVSRFVVGIFRQTLTVSKAWAADLSEPVDRSRNLSRFYAIISTGFIVGPAAGGALAKMAGYRFTILLSTVLFFINGAVVRTTLPQGKVLALGKSDKADGKAEETTPKSFCSDLGSLRPAVQKLLVMRFFIGIAVMLSRSGIFMLLEYREEWEFNIADKGLIISLFSVVQVVTQLFVVGPVSRKYSERKVITVAAALLACAQAACALATNFHIFLCAISAISVTSAVLKVAMSNVLTGAAGEMNRGEVLGVAGSVMSMCRAGSGLLSGTLVEWYDASAPGLGAAFSMVVVTALSTVLVPKAELKNKQD